MNCANKMDVATQLKRQFSTGSVQKSGRFSFRHQNSLDPRWNNLRFSFGRQSSLDLIRRSPADDIDLLCISGRVRATSRSLSFCSVGRPILMLVIDGGAR
nr:serine/threonine-protein kinase HT1-like isoform X1 [Ipomoea batatas]